MSTDKKFPQIDPDSRVISCFNCFQDHYDFVAISTDNKHGKYYIVCDSCNMRTYFDFKETTQCNDN